MQSDTDVDVNIWFLLRVNLVYSTNTNELKLPHQAERFAFKTEQGGRK